MWVYILFISSIFFLLTIKSNQRDNSLKLHHIIAIITIYLFLILRCDVGWDYSAYYNVIEDLDFELLILLWEPAHIPIVLLARYFNYPHIYMVVIGCISLSFTIYSIKTYNPKLWVIGVFVFLGLFYLKGFATMRQAAAVGIIVWGYRFVAKKQCIKYLLCCLFAFLFHYSSIAAIPIYYIYNYINKKNISLFIIAILCIPSILFLLSTTRYSSYLQEDLSGGNVIRFIYILILGGITILDYKAKTIAKHQALYYVIFLGCFAPFLLGGHIGGRVAEYYLCYFYFLIPRVLTKYNNETKILVCFFFCFLFLFQIYHSHINATEKDQYIPYTTIFDMNMKNPKFR